MSGRILHATAAGYPARTLVSPGGRLDATFIPALNMLGSSLVHAGEELLHLRAGIAVYAERAKTCGIPFLHPWANRLAADVYEIGGARVDLAGEPVSRDANGLPTHGLLGGTTEWEVTEETGGAATAELAARCRFDAPELLRRFPFPHDVAMTVAAGPDELAITTTVAATSDRDVPISFGYHPYFQIPGVGRDDWILENPATRHVVLDERSIPTGELEAVRIERGPLAGRTFDDCYTGIEGARVFALEAGAMRIEVEFGDAYPYVQIFAPPGADFVCIEPMTAPVAALTSGDGVRFAKPGEPFEAAFRIRILR